MRIISLGAFVCWPLFAIAVLGQTVPVPDNFWRLVAQEDTDHDQKITVHDQVTPFVIRDANEAPVLAVSNVYELSVLLQQLKSADDRHARTVPAESLQLHEDIVDRTHRLIKNVYWNALTRRIDGEHVDEVVHDSKVISKYDTIYVPGADAAAVNYFQGVAKDAAARHRSPALKVVLLPAPDKITGEFVRNLDGSQGILSLALGTNADGKISGVPYVVPGGRFNELYCWDSYFITLGLLADGQTNLARGMADNFLYEVRYYGKIPNANRSYYLTRSQPPFLTSILRAVYESGAGDKAWLAAALETAMTEYQNVWLGKDRLVKIGSYELSRYYDAGNGPCPEVEPGHYDEKIQPWLEQVNPAGTARRAVPVTECSVRRRNDPTNDSTSAPAGAGTSRDVPTNASEELPLTPYRFLNEYLYCGDYADLKADGLTLAKFFKNDRAVRESGHDTTHRFDDRTTDFVSIDLNSLLYKYETDFADLIESEFGGTLPGVNGEWAKVTFWRAQAAKRKAAMLALMWDEQRGYFFDYDFAKKKRSTYISATGLWPLWAKLLDTNNPAEMKMAQRTTAFGCEKLEQLAGLAATAQESVKSARRHDGRQWDYPYGWPPHQMLAWQGLKNYGLDADARRLAYRWLYCIAKNAHDYNGTVPEKYNVVTGSHDVFVEYGNVGTKFSYIAPEGFGWMNASFEVGMDFLSPTQLTGLHVLNPPPTSVKH